MIYIIKKIAAAYNLQNSINCAEKGKQKLSISIRKTNNNIPSFCQTVIKPQDCGPQIFLASQRSNTRFGLLNGHDIKLD